MICAAHQPNLFPWLGYFAKIAKADSFVFLDEVQFPQTSRGCWTNRVKILTSGKEAWLTCPIKRQGKQLIKNVTLADPANWKSKTLNTFKHFYSRSPYYAVTMEALAPLFATEEDNLASFNIAGIIAISQLLGLSCVFKIQSDLEDVGRDLFGSELLAAICQSVHATSYLAGDGAQEYEKPDCYINLGIGFAKNNFRHPQYIQQGNVEFVPGLSVVDALFQVGPEGTYDLLTN